MNRFRLVILDSGSATPDILPVQLNQIENVQRHYLVAPLIAEQVEHRQPVFVARNGFAVDYAGLRGQSSDSGNNQGEAPRGTYAVHRARI